MPDNPIQTMLLEKEQLEKEKEQLEKKLKENQEEINKYFDSKYLIIHLTTDTFIWCLIF